MIKQSGHNQHMLALVVLVMASLACSLVTGTQPTPSQSVQPPVQSPPVEPSTQPIPPTYTPLPTYTHLPTYTPEPTFTPQPTNTIQSSPTLFLDKGFFCREGPTLAYSDVTDFKAGIELPILGKSDAGWWLVKIDVSYTRHKSCWIGGGEVRGNQDQIPPTLATEPVVPVHAQFSWAVIGELSCAQIVQYSWEPVGGAGSGKFKSTSELFSHDNATILNTEWTPFCPGFAP